MRDLIIGGCFNYNYDQIKLILSIDLDLSVTKY